MTTTARELAENILDFVTLECSCETCKENLIGMITKEVEQAFERGRESVLSKLPLARKVKDSENYEARELYNCEGFNDCLKEIAKLKEPT